MFVSDLRVRSFYELNQTIIEEYRPREIASKLGVSRDAIYQRHKRAADVLKKSILRESRSF